MPLPDLKQSRRLKIPDAKSKLFMFLDHFPSSFFLRNMVRNTVEYPGFDTY